MAEQYAESCLSLATQQGFGGFTALGRVFRAWAQSQSGRTTTAVREIQDGMELARATGSDWFRPWFATLLCDVHLREGQAEAALALTEQAQAEIDRQGESQFQSIVFRTRADAFLALRPPNTSEAETLYHKAIEVARAQSAKLWELRAVMQLARLWHSQGKSAEARDLLAPVYGRFTEGFDTADLKEAKALLDELR
jgi:predicted ATPase